MKKAFSLFLIALLLVLPLSSCNLGGPEIEDYEWHMRVAMHIEDGVVMYDAVGEQDAAHPDAKVIKMTLLAKNGQVTITDNTNGTTYEGVYTVSGRNPGGTDYYITVDGKMGNAAVAMTTYLDGREEPTLPISLGGYSLYFYAE